MENNFNIKQIQNEIDLTDKELEELDIRAFRLWERIRIKPELWKQKQYNHAGKLWVVGILGRRCLYFNFVEGGWGWGRFEKWGKINEYHWQQDEIKTTIYHTLFAVDNGGNG